MVCWFCYDLKVINIYIYNFNQNKNFISNINHNLHVLSLQKIKNIRVSAIKRYK